MKILIVDDEYLILNELKNNINWTELGIEKILTAQSIVQAKNIISQNDIEIILCDIELPEGSGLDLLAWVKDNHPNIETLILTCHADFSYAKQAVNLGCHDYILKPVQYHELEAAISKAIKKINAEVKLQEHYNYGDYWLKHLPLMIERFWFHIVNQSIAPNITAIVEAAEVRNIPFSAEMKFLPLVIENRRWHQPMDLLNQKIMEFAMKNVAGETIYIQGETGLIFDYDRNLYIAILSEPKDSVFELETLHQSCAFFIESCNQYLGCDLNCYIGEFAYANVISDMVSQLLEMQRDNVAHDNCILYLNASYNKITPARNLTPDLKFWEILLSDGYHEKVIDESIKYLGRLLQTSSVDAPSLRQFDFEFMQMIYSVMKRNNIDYHELLGDKEAVRLHGEALQSIKSMETWISYILEKIQSHLQDINDQGAGAITKEVVRIVKKEIYQNISRNDIADMVHLNPDYLDRIFKKETGISVTRFIVGEKINIAKRLLAETELPVTILATKLGYTNISHFSSVFKKSTGLNPVDYRKSVANHSGLSLQQNR